MDDYLPPIRIYPRDDTRRFLRRMAELAAASGGFETQVLIGEPGSMGLDVVNLWPVDHATHEELGAQLVADPEQPGVVNVEIRARRWHPQHPPTYDTYHQSARDLITPLLREYNRAAGTRLRLTVVPRKRLEPSLPPVCQKLFKEFTSLANKSMLHPLDWRRFYRFARDCKARRQYTAEDIAHLLFKEGFPEDLAGYLGGL